MRTERAERAEQPTKEIGGFFPANGFSGANGDAIGEAELLLLLKQGDPEGLHHIKRKYHDKLYSVAYRICNNHPDAEEVLQDVYMTTVQKIDRFEERSTLATWLYRITVNAALMKRRSQRHSKCMVSLESVGPFLGQDENVLRFDGRARAQDDLLMVKELYGKIREIVDSLPEIYQSVFSLRDLQGYSIKETSKILNTTPAAIKSRLHRGRFFIKEELQRYLADN
ncbi:MAG: RNA polymerase sigma factor [Thermodesulfobacteriota bacterium]